MNSRTQAEKQFSIDSILGKEVEMLNKTLKNTLISNEKKLHRVKQMFLSFFFNKLFQDERENTDYSSYFSTSSPQKSFYREMQDFGESSSISICKIMISDLST